MIIQAARAFRVPITYRGGYRAVQVALRDEREDKIDRVQSAFNVSIDCI